MMKSRQLLVILILWSGLVASKAFAEPTEKMPISTGPGERCFRIGFQDFAWDKSTEADQAMFAFHRTHADIVCIQHYGEMVPWNAAYAGEPYPADLMASIEARKEGFAGQNIYLELSPLDMYRQTMGGQVSYTFYGLPLNDPKVKKAYTNYVRFMCEKFEPIYLSLGIEANIIAEKNPPLWPEFLDLYRHVYKEIKKVRPNLPIAFTVTLHSLLANVAEGKHDEVLEFREALDLCDFIGISFYEFVEPEDLGNPTKSFDLLKQFAGDKPIAVTETAYPAEGADFTPEKQVAYFEKLFKVAQRDGYLFIIDFTYRDYDVWWEKTKSHWDDWVKIWKDTGILDGDGNPRPAYALWCDWLQKRYTGPGN